MVTKFDANKYAGVSTPSDLYSDFTTNLDIHPGTNDAVRVKNEQAIVQSIRNLLLTDYGERPFAPMIGSNIRNMLFENISPDVSMMIKTSIEDTINNYEPRVKLIETIVEPAEDENGYNIRLKISLINSTTPIDIDFFLNRTR